MRNAGFNEEAFYVSDPIRTANLGIAGGRDLEGIILFQWGRSPLSLEEDNAAAYPILPLFAALVLYGTAAGMAQKAGHPIQTWTSKIGVLLTAIGATDSVTRNKIAPALPSDWSHLRAVAVWCCRTIAALGGLQVHYRL